MCVLYTAISSLQERDKLAAALPEYILPFVLFLMAHMPGEVFAAAIATAYNSHARVNIC
jgi:hypothetical protein